MNISFDEYLKEKCQSELNQQLHIEYLVTVCFVKDYPKNVTYTGILIKGNPQHKWVKNQYFEFF